MMPLGCTIYFDNNNDNVQMFQRESFFDKLYILDTTKVAIPQIVTRQSKIHTNVQLKHYHLMQNIQKALKLYKCTLSNAT